VSACWLVLGASSAIARAFARHAAANGDAVILAGRDRPDLEAGAADIALRGAPTAATLDFDARDHAGHPAFAARAAELAGGRPLSVFLAFGAMPSQAEIDADWREAWTTLDTNFVGAVSVLQALAPHLEARKAGNVIALSSVAGDRGRLKNYVYGAAKAGLTTYLQGLRARLFRAGVAVTTVKPGFVDTAMTWGLPGMFLVASPESVAAACYAAAKKGKEEIYVPFFWWGIMTIIRNIPERIFKKLSI
jgi:decaprenylphospho-beta-D-erythro-pentofuranosid-2-ulose 2-reductase